MFVGDAGQAFEEGGEGVGAVAGSGGGRKCEGVRWVVGGLWFLVGG